MDDLVLQAMAKWPNVPNCYGWLGLDERGDWYMRDERVQSLGDFKEACLSGNTQAKGSKLSHEKLIGFIHRNYACDVAGQWYFQNGPQRVYVDLADTPYIWRLHRTPKGLEIRAHTGEQTSMQKCFLDAVGKLYALTPLGLGLVHTLDTGLAADALESGEWVLATSQLEQLLQDDLEPQI